MAQASRTLVKLVDVTEREGRGESADARLVGRAVEELRKIVVGSQAETLIEVGEYLIKNFYGGVDEAVSHRARKVASLRSLAARAGEFGMKANGVMLSVPLALQARIIGKTLSLRLSPSQQRALLPVPGAEQKKLLGEAAADAHWSYQKLKDKAAKLHKPHAGGRPREPKARLVVRRIARAFEGAVASASSDAAGALSRDEAVTLLSTVNFLQAELSRIEHAIQKQALGKTAALGSRRAKR